MYAEHPLVLNVSALAAKEGLACAVDEEGLLTLSAPEGGEILALSIANVPADPMSPACQAMTLDLGKVIATRDASILGKTAYGVRHDGTVEEMPGVSVSTGDDGGVEMSFSLGGERDVRDNPNVRGINPRADRMADMMSEVAAGIEGVSVARTGLDAVKAMDADGLVCATFAVSSYADSGVDLDDPWLRYEIADWLCEQADLPAPDRPGEDAIIIQAGGESIVFDPSAGARGSGSPEDRLFDCIADLAGERGLRAVRTGPDGAEIHDEGGSVLTVNLAGMASKGLADKPGMVRLQILSALESRVPLNERTDGWLMMHLRRDGLDFYSNAAVVDRFTSAGVDLALIAHYEDNLALHHLTAGLVEDLGGVQAVRDRVIADRDRAEFIIQAVDRVTAPDGTEALMLVGDNIATLLVHPGLHHTLVEAIDMRPDELAAPDAPMGPMMAFAPSTTIIGIFPTASINEMLPVIREWSEGVTPPGEPLLYGCLLRNYPDEKWGRLIDRTGG